MTTEFGTALGGDGASERVGRETATAALRQMNTDRVDFCQVFASPAHEFGPLLAGIRSVIGDDAVLIGCSSAGELTDEGVEQGGVAIGLVTSDDMAFYSAAASGLADDVSATVEAAATALPQQVEGYPYLSGITLHDGLVGAGEQIAWDTQRELGQHVGLAGGAAGDDLHMEATHVFHDNHALEDGIVLALIASQEPTVITLDHGHEPISAPLVVTGTDDSLVTELDGEPAFDVWRDIIADHARERFGIDIESASDQSLAELATHYQFGIDQGWGNHKIRWPGLEVPNREAGHLRFTLNIPEGTVLRVTASSEADQIDCVRRAASDALMEMGDTEVAGGFVYECFCRSDILGDRFAAAPAALGDELGEPFVGFQTYGELCMARDQMSGFHNTTSVIMLLPE